jgi:hypothetical protein
MSAIDHLRAIGRGETPANDGLLGNTRCGWGRSELMGEESILAAFCTRPFADTNVVAVETTQGVALIGQDDALIADVYDGHIGRLWRVGDGVALPHEPAIDVAFDLDMRQQRGDVLFRADDHPELSPACSERVLDAARAHVSQLRRAGALRSRAFVLRAFGNEDAAAALLAVHTMGNETNRTAGFSYAILAVGAQDASARIVSDRSRPRNWSPRF